MHGINMSPRTTAIGRSVSTLEQQFFSFFFVDTRWVYVLCVHYFQSTTKNQPPGSVPQRPARHSSADGGDDCNVQYCSLLQGRSRMAAATDRVVHLVPERSPSDLVAVEEKKQELRPEGMDEAY